MKIWVVQLHPTEGHVLRGPVPLIDRLKGPQGIDTVKDDSKYEEKPQTIRKIHEIITSFMAVSFVHYYLLISK